MNSPKTQAEPPDKTQAELDQEVRRAIARETRRSFLLGGAAALAGIGAWEWLRHAPEIDQLKAPLRHAENWNAKLGSRLFGESAHAPTYPRSQATVLRVNNDVGLIDVAPGNWRLQVVGLDRPEQYPQFTPDVGLWDYQTGNQTGTSGISLFQGLNVMGGSSPANSGMTKTPGILLTMADILKLPHREMIVQFKCIEGWSQICQWEGARFSDFMKAYPPKRNPDGNLPKYVAMETPEGDFFSGYGMASLVHPQTLLCYRMAGVPLTPLHGAPLRLAMPLKYGYKQIKQIARITYTNHKPPDYWATQGYDWYGGL